MAAELYVRLAVVKESLRFGMYRYVKHVNQPLTRSALYTVLTNKEKASINIFQRLKLPFMSEPSPDLVVTTIVIMKPELPIKASLDPN